MAKHKTLPEQNRANIEREVKRRREDPAWGIILSDVLERVFVRDDDLEQTSMYATLVACRLQFRTLPTTTEGVSCIELVTPVDVLATYESFMRGTMAVLRQSGAHGRYHCHAKDVDKYYEF